MKKINIILTTFIKIGLLFILIDLLLGIFPSSITDIVINSKYSRSIIAELTAAIIALIVVILSSNHHIFTDKRKSFIESIYIGLPMFIISIIYLISSTFSIIDSNTLTINNILALMIYCLLIGVFEELLCRGWILNEFLKVSNTNRKDVITSIIVSSLLFGLMHISNIWIAGQNTYITFLQICNAIALGSFLGAVYYRTKNISSVIFLHAFYDFSLLLSEVSLLKECTTNELTKNVMLYETVTISLLIVVYILCTIIILRKSKLNPLLEEPNPLSKESLLKEKRFKLVLIISIIVINFLPIPRPKEEEYLKSQTCYNYNIIKLKEYEITTTTKTKYNIEYRINRYIENSIEDADWIDNDAPNKTSLPGEYSFNIYTEENRIIFENTITKYKIELEYPNIKNIYVYTYQDNTNILIQTYENYNSIIYYSNYIHKNNLSNDKQYLEELSRSFKKIVTPDSKELGILTTEDNIYPLIKTMDGDIMIIDNEELLLVK